MNYIFREFANYIILTKKRLQQFCVCINSKYKHVVIHMTVVTRVRSAKFEMSLLCYLPFKRVANYPPHRRKE